MTSNQSVKYAVDIVICIDATASMGPVLDVVKSSALDFYNDLSSEMKERQKSVEQLRAKVIVFRDYYCDSPNMAMVSSPFFNLKEQSNGFADFVSTIEATGGGDEPENGLEALALALNSEWEKGQSFAKKRYVVVVYTDASAHPLEKTPKPTHYPSTIPQTIDELTDLWEEMTHSFKRLLLFAPDSTPWSMIESAWENTIHFPSQAGQGLQEIENKEIITAIASSI